MAKHHGDCDAALSELQRLRLAELRQAIWAADAGDGVGRHDYERLDPVLRNKDEDFEVRRSRS